FWPSQAGDQCFDPRVILDPYTNTFIMLVLLTNGNPKRSFYLLAVETGPDTDPPKPWCLYATLDASLDNTTPTDNYADFPGLAVDSQAIYITSNQFPFSGGPFSYAKIRIINKNTVFGCQP